MDMVRDDLNKIDVIGHRGYAAVRPENTLPSFRAAMGLGVDWIETDVQLTKDGVPVLFHDTDLERITGQKGTVADCTYEQLQKMDAGKWFGDAYAGTKIPTLEEFLLLIEEDDVRVYLELKDIGAVDGFVPKVYESVAARGMLDRVVFASFNYDYLSAFKLLDDNAKILLNTEAADALWLEEKPAEYYGLSVDIAAKQMIDRIHEAGSKAFVWTVDSPQMIHDVIDMGVDGICSNRIDVAMAGVMEKFLAQRGI